MCTSFVLEGYDQLIVGTNMDWTTGTGLMTINKRHVEKTSLILYHGVIADRALDEKPFTWVSDFGSVSFNMYGCESPWGGMNEKGLVICNMALGDTEYEAQDDRPAVTADQWKQHMFDTCGTVDEVIEKSARLRVRKEGTSLSGVHFLLCDANGHAAIVEFLSGKAQWRSGESLPYGVLTNNTYECSLSYLKLYDGFGGDLPLSTARTGASLDRFTRTVHMVGTFSGKRDALPVDYAFSTLQNAAQVDSAWPTKLSIVYDVNERQMHFRTERRETIKSIDLGSLDFSAESVPKLLDVDIESAGDVTHTFAAYDREYHRQIVGKAFSETPELAGMSQGVTRLISLNSEFLPAVAGADSPQEERSIQEYCHPEPSFRIAYPGHYIQTMRLQSMIPQFAAFGFSAGSHEVLMVSVSEIPDGATLNSMGAFEVARTMLVSLTEVRLVSSETVVLGDGTRAALSHIQQTGRGIDLSSLALSVLEKNRWISIWVSNPGRISEEQKSILFSLDLAI